MIVVSYLVHYDTLLQNATDLLQNATAILIQNVTKVYYKMRQVFYYKIRQLLQNATTLLLKCDSYYKMRRLLQNVSLHSSTANASEIISRTSLVSTLI